MRLKVVPEVTEELIKSAPAGTKLVGYRQFNDITMHPFIATTQWEDVEIVLSKGIRAGFIKQLCTLHSSTRGYVQRGTPLDYGLVSLVIECYPALEIELRKAVLTKTDVGAILEREGIYYV